MTKQKNHQFLIKTFNQFHKEQPNSILLLIGNGELEHDIKAKIKKYNIEKVLCF